MSCRYATHIITVSEHWRQALISRGVPESKCSVVMNVADTSIFHPRESQALRMNNSHSFRLIYHGSMVKRYGIDLAIQSVNQLRNETPGIHLSLIGQGDFLPDILELISSLNLHDQVTIQKKCLAEDLPDLILACDLGIVPYRNDVFTDGLLPTKLMEYAALGLPVVASRTTAIQTHFSGMNVEFFEPGSVDDLVRVIRLLQHQPDRIMELKRGCQNFNERFDWTKISAEYVGLVDSLSQIHQEAPAMAVE
jgi:glycosyltransferase involved in cell wall biosynthesis